LAAGVQSSTARRKGKTMMKKTLWILVALALAAWMTPQLTAADNAPGKIRVLLVTGGHGFERPQFFKLFEDNPEITFDAVEHPDPKDKNAPATDPFAAKLRPDAAKAYDVIVLYDMWQKITDEAKADFVALLKDGKGLVVLHHAIANYEDWEEFHKISGGRYYLKPTVVNGVEKARCLWKHDVDIKVHLPNPSHPVVRGLKDYELHDETYKGYDVRPDVTPLLATEEPLSAPVIGWAHAYGKARVVYIQHGHDHVAFESPIYRQMVAQAIRWTAGK
jgi:uncharacterized protein